MNRLITPEFIAQCQAYPLGSQSKSDIPEVVAKFFDSYGSASWYVIELDPEQELAFGYVTGLQQDELGYFSLSELASIIHPTLQVPRIEQDAYFSKCRLNEIR
ncbi:DUF2958 domain-containing protein [Pseudoalteromonas rubra]|uniref:DUF2958 domain-containing protein n=1 Tax=Pseudoalteromonas rubra TaxID=43658 RepID=UPI002DBD0252|nr:DUF2958 domain-containing protein [Pseudoalteromonas rubra]MEC4090903.1 DUF2958 domain-containing protein [Pseudoalteromonas rubra]